MTSHRPIALITGASSGIGAIYADRLARRGHDLILVARQSTRLSKTASRIKAATGVSVETVSADLTDPADQRRIAMLFTQNAAIRLLVNNAGVGATDPLSVANPEDMARMISLNVGAMARLAQAAAMAFAGRDQGGIINMASITAVHPEILNGVYGATKAFVLALSQSLLHEFGGKGVRVQVVLPGAVATDFWAQAGRPVEHLPGEIVMPAEAMVDAALAGYDQGEFATLPSLPDAADWDAYERARQHLLPNLSRAVPAARYRVSEVI